MLNFLFQKTPLNYLAQSIWRDEAFSYLLAKKNFWQILSLSAQDFSPPLYPLLLKFWISIFGASEIALRSLSFVAYLFTFYFFYMFLTKILKTDRNWTVVYSVLFFINPFLNYYAFEARAYSLFSLLTIASFYYFLSKKKLPYIVTTVFGLYTHYFMVFVLASQALISLVSNLAHSEKREQLKTFGKAFLFFVPWVLFFFLKNRVVNDSFWIEPPTLRTLVRLPSILYLGFEGNFNFFKEQVFGFSLLLYTLIILSSINILKNSRHKELLKVFTIWVFVPALLVYLISLFKPIFFPRYLILAATGSVLLLVLLIDKLKGFLKIAIVVLLILLTLKYNNLQVANRKKAPIRQVAREVRAQTKPGDLVYVTDILAFHAAQYYFGEDRVFVYNKSYDEIPAFVGRVLIPKEKIASFLPFYPKKAFIIFADLNYNVQAVF